MRRNRLSRAAAGYAMLGALGQMSWNVLGGMREGRRQQAEDSMRAAEHALKMQIMEGKIELQRLQIEAMQRGSSGLPDGVKQCPTCMEYYSATMSGCPECSRGNNTQDERPDYARTFARGSTSGK